MLNLKCFAGFLSIQWNVIPSKVVTFLYVGSYLHVSGFGLKVSRWIIDPKYANLIYNTEHMLKQTKMFLMLILDGSTESV